MAMSDEKPVILFEGQSNMTEETLKHAYPWPLAGPISWYGGEGRESEMSGFEAIMRGLHEAVRRGKEVDAIRVHPDTRDALKADFYATRMFVACEDRGDRVCDRPLILDRSVAANEFHMMKGETLVLVAM